MRSFSGIPLIFETFAGAVGVLHHDLFDLLEILGPFRNEVLVLPAVFQDLMHEAVEDGNIGSGVKRQVQVCLLRRWGESRVSVDDFCTLRLCLHHAATDQRVGLKRVAADDKKAFGLGNICNRLGHCTGSERTGQPNDRRCMAETGAVVDVGGL